jgi:hypothetical protein
MLCYLCLGQAVAWRVWQGVKSPFCLAVNSDIVLMSSQCTDLVTAFTHDGKRLASRDLVEKAWQPLVVLTDTSVVMQKPSPVIESDIRGMTLNQNAMTLYLHSSEDRGDEVATYDIRTQHALHPQWSVAPKPHPLGTYWVLLAVHGENVWLAHRMQRLVQRRSRSTGTLLQTIVADAPIWCMTMSKEQLLVCIVDESGLAIQVCNDVPFVHPVPLVCHQLFSQRHIPSGPLCGVSGNTLFLVDGEGQVFSFAIQGGPGSIFNSREERRVSPISSVSISGA